MALETILLAVGANDEGRAEALAGTVADLAESGDATVYVAHVFGPAEYDDVSERLTEGGETPSRDEIAGRHAPVRAIVDRLTEAGIRPEIRGAVGDHADTVIDLAEELDADLLVIGGRTRTPAGKAVFGSTGQAILLHAPCPVTFVRGE